MRPNLNTLDRCERDLLDTLASIRIIASGGGDQSITPQALARQFARDVMQYADAATDAFSATQAQS
jgi:hypothetical protein